MHNKICVGTIAKDTHHIKRFLFLSLSLSSQWHTVYVCMRHERCTERVVGWWKFHLGDRKCFQWNGIIHILLAMKWNREEIYIPFVLCKVLNERPETISRISIEHLSVKEGIGYFCSLHVYCSQSSFYDTCGSTFAISLNSIRCGTIHKKWNFKPNPSSKSFHIHSAVHQ